MGLLKDIKTQLKILESVNEAKFSEYDRVRTKGGVDFGDETFVVIHQKGNDVTVTDDEDETRVFKASKLELAESVNEEDEEELEEASTTGAVAGYNTPNAFGDKSATSKKKRKKYSTSSTGYKMVKEVSLYKRMITQMYELNEISYHDYKKDPTSTPAQKVNRSIQEVNRMLGEIDKTVNHNLKLKLEAGVDSSHFWKSTERRFGKIGERLVKISNRIKELSQ